MVIVRLYRSLRGEDIANPASKMPMSSSRLRNISSNSRPLVAVSRPVTSSVVVERLWVVVEDLFSMTSHCLVVCLNKNDELFQGSMIAEECTGITILVKSEDKTALGVFNVQYYYVQWWFNVSTAVTQYCDKFF
jgi:hypothetical protein